MTAARSVASAGRRDAGAEDRVRDAEEWLRALSDNLPDGLVYQIDSGVDGRERRFSYISGGVEALHGISATEAMEDASRIYRQVHAEDLRMVAEQEAVAFAAMAPLKVELRVVLPSGETRWRLFNSAPRRLSNGHLVWDGIEIDTTERRRAEQALRRSEEDLQALFEGSREAIMLLDARGVVLNANAAMCRRMQVAKTRFVGTSAFAALPRDLAKARRARYRTVLRNGKSLHFEDERNGRVMENHMYPIRGSSGDVTRVAVFVNDITERKRAEKAMLASRDELERKVAERTARLRALAARLTHAEHRERRRIAEVLHEDIQQHLVAMQYRVSALRERVKDGPMARDAQWLLDELNLTIRLSHDLTVRLRPPVLYELGLRPALEWLADDMRHRFGLTVAIGGVKAFRLQSDEFRMFAFEAVSELLMNVVKHAGVKRARIRIHWAGKGRIGIEVSDTGKGCAFERPTQEMSFGLFSIRERIEALGGSFAVVSCPGKGTCATLVLPARRPDRPVPGSRPRQRLRPVARTGRHRSASR